MAFSEKIKLIVKKKSHLQCCLCKEIGIEIHHIIPQSENGANIESNAAPLCPTCHEIYGDNPKKRKFITEARDLWYEICETRYRFDTKELVELKNTVKELPTHDCLLDFKEQIINAVKQKTSIEDIIGKKGIDDNSEIIKELNIFEVITYIYHSRSRRSDKNHELILMPELWSKEDGFDEVLEEFMFHFGYNTAAIVVNRIMDDMNIPDEDGLTEDEVIEILHVASIEMIIMNMCNNHQNKALLNKTGEISWRNI